MCSGLGAHHPFQISDRLVHPPCPSIAYEPLSHSPADWEPHVACDMAHAFMHDSPVRRGSLGGHTRTYVCVCTSVCICSFRDKPHFVHVKHTPPCMIQNAAWGLQGGLQPWLIAGAWQCTRHACALSKCCMTCCMMTLCVRVPVCTHRSRQHRSAAL